MLMEEAFHNGADLAPHFLNMGLHISLDFVELTNRNGRLKFRYYKTRANNQLKTDLNLIRPTAMLQRHGPRVTREAPIARSALYP